MHFLEQGKVNIGTNEMCPHANESCSIVESKGSIAISSSFTNSSSNEGRLSTALSPPITADSYQGACGEQTLRLNNLLLSPLSSLCNAPTTLLETPKDCIFDSFGRDSSKFMLAPYCEECSKQFPVHSVRRRLSFESDKDSMGDIASSDDSCSVDSKTEAEEEALIELVCSTFLDSIVAEEKDRILPNLGTRGWGLDGFKTPDNVPQISEECPGAPRKAINQIRRLIINKRLCRKLEF